MTMPDKKTEEKKNKKAKIRGAWSFESPKHASFRASVFYMVEVGYDEDIIGRGYDVFSLLVIAVNLLISVLLTFDDIVLKYGELLSVCEGLTVLFFAIDYVLRLWTSSFLYPAKKPAAAMLGYIFSLNGIVDILSFLPYYLPVFFPQGAVAFRLFRLMRIFRLFRVNAYYDSLNVITEVLKSKAKQLISSVFVIFLLILASSLCMYSVEHEAQPEVFDNALSGIWWASATLLTVGYGDIYPITPLGRVLGTLITFLGVGAAAIPTGIISAGFVEQYSRLQGMAGENTALQIIKLKLSGEDGWEGKRIADISFPGGMIVAAVLHAGEVKVPRGDLVLSEGDVLVLGAEPCDEGVDIYLTEVTVEKGHEWEGVKIKDLDISRQTFIITVKRKKKAMVPNGSFVIRAGDTVVMYTKGKRKQ